MEASDWTGAAITGLLVGCVGLASYLLGSLRSEHKCLTEKLHLAREAKEGWQRASSHVIQLCEMSRSFHGNRSFGKPSHWIKESERRFGDWEALQFKNEFDRLEQSDEWEETIQ